MVRVTQLIYQPGDAVYMTRRTLDPIVENDAASLFALDGNFRLVEFHSKANALTDESMQIVAAAATDHGAGIIIHNDAQHFSAGVDLNAFRQMIETGAWDEMDDFLWRFQQAVAMLKYAPVPVVGAHQAWRQAAGLKCWRIVTGLSFTAIVCSASSSGGRLCQVVAGSRKAICAGMMRLATGMTPRGEPG